MESERRRSPDAGGAPDGVAARPISVGASIRSTSFGRGLDQVAAARDWVRQQLHDLSAIPDEQLQLALVGVSELVTNVLRHTTSTVRVELRVVGAEVRIDVGDRSSDALPVMRPVDPERIGGNGIRIVDALADDWGCDVDGPQGKRVWFTVCW